MTVKDFADFLSEMAEDPRVADLEICVSKVTHEGAQIYGPIISSEYGRSGEFVIYEKYCILPFTKARGE